MTATGTPTGVTVDWADSTDATGYHVYRATTDTGTFTELTTDPVTDPTLDDTLAPSRYLLLSGHRA